MTYGRHLARPLGLIAALMLFGAAKLPFEQKLNDEFHSSHFRGAKLSLGLREQIGQLGFVAALSGFRATVADLIWIQANTAWQNVQWGRMVLLFNSATALQPRVLMFWETAAWHMAWNASVAARENPHQPKEALRIRAEHEYWQVGRDFLERGVRNNPDRYELYDQLGFLLREKMKDHQASSDAYAKAAAFPNAPSYEKRFAAYEFSYVEGREREAYAFLLRLYRMGPSEHLPTLLRRLKVTEDKLNIPIEQRVYIPPSNLQ